MNGSNKTAVQVLLEASEIPSVSLAMCEWNPKAKRLTLASEYMGMPRSFYVVSHKTGKEFRFREIGPEDILYDEDQWDGEQKIYRPVGHCPVDHMVIYHQF